MTIVHLEPEEFIQKLFVSQSKLQFHIIPLENKSVTVVYYFLDGCFTYYLDRIFEGCKSSMTQDLHADIYRKMALMQSCSIQ